MGTATESRQADGARGKVQSVVERSTFDLQLQCSRGRQDLEDVVSNPERSCCGVG